jgi:hypothetical protein
MRWTTPSRCPSRWWWVQAVEDHPAQWRQRVETGRANAQEVDRVGGSGGAVGQEREPAEGQREGGQRGQHHAPEQQLVGDPTAAAPRRDEGLQAEIAHHRARHRGGHAVEAAPEEERAPAAAQIAPGRRAGDPDRVSVHHTERQHHRGGRVADQRGVEVAQVATAQIDRGRGDRRGGRASQAGRQSRRAWPPGPFGSLRTAVSTWKRRWGFLNPTSRPPRIIHRTVVLAQLRRHHREHRLAERCPIGERIPAQVGCISGSRDTNSMRADVERQGRCRTFGAAHWRGDLPRTPPGAWSAASRAP